MKACDSLVQPSSVEEARRLAEVYSVAGVGLVFVEAPSPETAREYARVLRGEGLEAYTRVTVEAKDWGQASRLVRRAAQYYDLVAVRPRTAEAARLAARDPGVAIVQLPPGMARFMDKSQALMLREGRAVAEIKLSAVVGGGDPRRGLRGVMIIARRAAAYEAPLVAGSGARSRWGVWAPASVIGLLASFGAPVSYAKLVVYKFCRMVIDLYTAGKT